MQSKTIDPLAHESPAEPQGARVIVFITFHYRKSRLRYLFEVIRTLTEFPVAFMTIVIVTNTSFEAEIICIRTLGLHAVEGMKEMQILSFPNLLNGLDLPWSHKPALRRAFEEASEEYSHFVYLEDDERFSYANFCYFVRCSAPLALHGLIPGFLRIEYNFTQDDLYSTDIVISEIIGNRSSLILGNSRFINSEHPYMGMFVMDRRHLAEYLASASFDKERSAKVSSWGTQERAAMGLMWETVPAGYTSRSVLPIDLSTRRASPSCYIHHLPNNYTNDETTGVPFGKVRIGEAFF